MLAALPAVACSAMQTEGDWLFVRNDGADLPVWVRGDTSSGVFIVWLAGGPGDPVVIAQGAATDALEASYGMVFWDQRGSGSAQGNASPDSFTVEQLVDDVDAIVDVVADIYEPERLFLLGHSWGGTLGTAYLLEPDHQSKLAGWIDVAGNHDPPLVYPMKIAWLEDYATRRIAAGEDVSHWTEVRDWCASDPPLTVENFDQWDTYVSDTDATFHNPDVGFDIGFDLLFLSGESAFAYLAVNSSYASDHVYDDVEAFQAFSFSSRMGDITLPTALLWGRHDGIVPLPASDAAMEVLGTPPDELHRVVFEDSAHFPFLEEPQAFERAVADFVEVHR